MLDRRPWLVCHRRAVLCGVKRARRLVSALTLLTLILIALGVTGFHLPLLRPGGSSSADRPLPGVRVTSADRLLRVGAGAPAGADLAFLAVEPSGNLVVSDQKRNTIMRFDPSGHLLSEWGPRLGDTTLSQPAGVAVQADGVYWVLDRGTPRLFRLDASGRVQGMLSLENQGTYGLNGLAVDASGNLYVADTGRNRILVLSLTGAIIRQIGHQGADLGGFTQPMNLAFAPDGSFFVADWENARLERFDTTFNATDAWSTGFRPFGVVVDQLGRVFAPDADRRLIEAYTPRGAPLGELSAPDSTPLDVTPHQLAFARAGQPALYALGGEGITRLVLENTPPPPQGSQEFDLLSLVLFLLLLGSLAAAFWARRGRRRRVALVGALHGPVRLHAENGAQRQDQQPQADQQLLVAHQAEGEDQAAEEHEQAKQDAEARHHV
jgi:DNA-binding beta-propeller fold protein YncE